MKTPSSPTIALFVLILATLLADVWVYPRLPDRVSPHLGVEGSVIVSMPKEATLVFIPVLLAIFLILYWVIPKIRPMKGNIEKFQEGYDTLWLTLAYFAAYIHMLLLASNLGVARFDFTVGVLPAVAVLWYVMGTILIKAKNSYRAFIGIRTPWTMKSDVVWDKTHAFGGNAFKVAALVLLFGLFSPSATIGFIIIPVALAALASVIYSYVVWRGLRPPTPPTPPVA
jgi:uncharacterized membrane protein